MTDKERDLLLMLADLAEGRAMRKGNEGLADKIHRAANDVSDAAEITALSESLPR